MNPCKAKLTDGKPCPNQADKGQEYCPYHLSDQVRKPKKIGSVVAGVLGVLVINFVRKNAVKIVKAVANFIRI